MSFYFNTLIDTGAVRASLLHPGLNGTLDLYRQNFDFHPQTPLAPNTTYTLTMQTTMRTIGGQFLKSPYIYSFTTGN
jgi:hypothetical protein